MCLPVFAADAPAPVVTEIHGFMQNRFYAAEGSNARYRLERVSVNAQRPLGDATGYVEVYFHPWLPSSTANEQFRTYLESAYVDVPVGEGRFRAGKGRHLAFGMVPSYGNRKTSNYGLVSETFTQDRVTGVQYYLAKKDWEVAASLTAAPSIGSRPSGLSSSSRTSTIFHLADRDITAEGADPRKMNISARLGTKKPNLFAGISGSYGKLNQEDLTFLNTVAGIPVTGKNRTRYGIDAMWKPVTPWVVQGEFYTGDTGGLDMNAWDILVGYEPKDKVKFYARYSQYNIDTPSLLIGALVPGVSAPQGDITWDQQQVSLSMVIPIRKTVWLQLEEELNFQDEPAGAASGRNNVFFAELFTAF
jgi:hypothetical protein